MALCYQPSDILFYVKRNSSFKYPDDKHCPISFLDFKQGEEISKLPCGHIFHKEARLHYDLERLWGDVPVIKAVGE